MAHTYINARHRQYAEDCMKIIEETAKKHYTAEQMLARCRRNLGLDEAADQQMGESAYALGFEEKTDYICE